MRPNLKQSDKYEFEEEKGNGSPHCLFILQTKVALCVLAADALDDLANTSSYKKKLDDSTEIRS